MLKFNILIFLSLLLISCKYDDIYSGDPTPKISNVSTNQIEYKQFTDTVVIAFDYQDGDGDLGFESADSLSVEVKDFRFAKADYYHLKPLSPMGSKIAVSGKIRIVLKNIFLLGGGSAESTKFQIRIKDRSQKWSNVLVTQSIGIKK